MHYIYTSVLLESPIKKSLKTTSWSPIEDSLIKHVTWPRKEMTGNSLWCFLQYVLISEKKANRLELIYRLYLNPMKVWMV